jgi:hypothetical protein
MGLVNTKYIYWYQSHIALLFLLYGVTSPHSHMSSYLSLAGPVSSNSFYLCSIGMKSGQWQRMFFPLHEENNIKSGTSVN